MKKFSRHWLETVKLPDVTLLGASDDGSESDSSDGGYIEYSQNAPQVFNAGSYVQCDDTSVSSQQSTYMSLTVGDSIADLRIVHNTSGYNVVARINGGVVCSWPYFAGNAIYMEIDVSDADGSITFWADGNSYTTNPSSSWRGGATSAVFGAAASSGDRLMPSAFMEAVVAYGSSGNWTSANFNTASVDKTNSSYNGTSAFADYLSIV